MKAVVYRRFGPPQVAQVEEIPDPGPGPDEVRVRVRTTVVATADAAFRAGKPFSARLFAGPIRPRIRTLGSLFAGNVDAVGADVTDLRTGDRVVGLSGPRLGAHAECVCVPKDSAIVTAPTNLTDAEVVAAVEGGMTALPFLRDVAGLRHGQSIVVNGASGAVGSAAVQLAKHFGAVVTGVCSTAHRELVASLGADEVIDYTRDDFTRRPERHDVVFDAVGRSSFARCKDVLKPGGIYLTPVLSAAILWQAIATKRRPKRAAIAFTGLRPAGDMANDLRLLTELAGTGRIRPVIDGRYPLDRVAEAYRRVDTGHKAGSVVLVCGPDS